LLSAPNKAPRQSFAVDAQVAAINRFTELTVAQLREVKTDVEIVQRVQVNAYLA
jgi:hypothetical protein